MEGYTKLATVMGAYPEVAIVRRFASLNMQNILYLQAEITELEAQLRIIEEEDRLSGDTDRTDCAFDWLALRDYVNPEQDKVKNDEELVSGGSSARVVGERLPSNARWRLLTEIRAKLKEYSKCT